MHSASFFNIGGFYCLAWVLVLVFFFLISIPMRIVDIVVVRIRISPIGIRSMSMSTQYAVWAL